MFAVDDWQGAHDHDGADAGQHPGLELHVWFPSRSVAMRRISQALACVGSNEICPGNQHCDTLACGSAVLSFAGIRVLVIPLGEVARSSGLPPVLASPFPADGAVRMDLGHLRELPPELDRDGALRSAGQDHRAPVVQLDDIGESSLQTFPEGS